MSRTRLILGTAGHIDHGKTSLVRALTGVDTDRLVEEKKRGITIELGFAHFAPVEECSFGIVDVPGHEGFVRTMVAGATGMDVVLLVVAADEGVMPQTREHLSIVRLLGVERMVVALTKVDLVEAEWLDLVVDEVGELLAPTPYRDADIVGTSVETGAGLEALTEALVRCGMGARRRTELDLVRLPVDRVFSVGGAGTVVTGTLWSGRLSRGDSVRLLPRNEDARVRAIQVHGEDVDAAVAGQRTAVALTGAAVRRGLVERGDVLVVDPSWHSSMMLTVELISMTDSGWNLEAGQRVRVHLSTVEVMARVALFGEERVVPGEPTLAQLRLEAPVVARVGDRFVIRSYSPVTTIAGGVVLEPMPPKRKRLTEKERGALEGISRGGTDAVRGAVHLAGWKGVPVPWVPVLAGPSAPSEAELGGVALRLGDQLFDAHIATEGRARILDAVSAYHAEQPLESGAPLDVLRRALPGRAHEALADGLAGRMADDGSLVIDGSRARLPEFAVVLSQAQERVVKRLMSILDDAGLQGPSTQELPPDLRDGPSTPAVLQFMASSGMVHLVGDAFWVKSEELEDAAGRVQAHLGGRGGLGPADFREVLAVTRKHLIPILTWLDATGVTVRDESGRRVIQPSD